MNQQTVDFYLALGMFPIPTEPEVRKPIGRWRTINSPDQIPPLWERHDPLARIGILTGPSRVLVVDVDVKKGKDGPASLATWLAENGEDPAEALEHHPVCCRTPSGGLHLYYSLEEGEAWPDESTTGVDVLPGIDLRGRGGFVVCPPSSFEGKQYKWTRRWNKREQIPFVPHWLWELVQHKNAGKKPQVCTPSPAEQAPADFDVQAAAEHHLARALSVAMVGTRNDTGFKLAAQLRDLGLPQGDASTYMERYAAGVPQAGNKDDYDAREAEATLKGCYGSAARDPAVPRAALPAHCPPANDPDDPGPDDSSYAHLALVPPDADDSMRPSLYAGQTDLAVLVDNAWAALVAHNSPPRLFFFGGSVGAIRDDDNGQATVRHQSSHAMREHLARAVRWFLTRPGKKGKEMERYDAKAPLDLAQVMLAGEGVATLPALNRTVSAPLMAPSGRIVAEPGYDEETRTYYVDGGLKVPAIPDEPTSGQVDAARDLLLHDLLGDFPFLGAEDAGDMDSDSRFLSSPDRANTLGLFILPFARELINGPTPLHLIEKPSPGSGASLIFQALGHLVSGGDPAIITEATTEDEWRKRITSTLLQCPGVVAFDNLRQRLDSSALAAALTTNVWEDRRLGSSTNVRIPVRTVWVATGNNPAVSSEIARRTVSIRIDTHLEKPWERKATSFRHPKLLQWTAKNRPALVAAVLTLLRAWTAAGRPKGTASLGSYEGWADVIGGVLGVAGVHGFLANRTRFYDRADSEASDWRTLIETWWGKYHDSQVKTADIWQMIHDTDIPFPLSGRTDQAQKVALGRKLTASADKRFTFGTQTLLLTRGAAGRTSWQYRLMALDPGKPTPTNPPSSASDRKLC